MNPLVARATPVAGNVAVIAGATGQIGASIGRHFMWADSWSVVGLSRRQRQEAPFPILAVDLLDAQDCRAKLSDVSGVTHLIYAARHDHAGGAPESADINASMLANLLAAFRGSDSLRHVHLVHGTKYYGHAHGSGTVPYREDAPRHEHPLFYYPQQDLVVRLAKEQGWGWTISRPHSFCDLNPDEPRSITRLVAVYASVLRELGLPLIFPGSRRAFEARTQFTWLPMLARAVEWMATEPACANQAFNVVNDDPQPWSVLWPMIAGYFDMPWGGPDPQSLTRFPDGRRDVWQSMIKAHGLRDSDLRTVVQWAYADYVFAPEWDVVSSMDKAREYGFTEKVESSWMWRASFDFYRAGKWIP
ncbi:MAG: NAD-dependent epimerase/dehydratase family protein [Candidimonas sp.]